MPRPSSKDKVVAAFHAHGWTSIAESEARVPVRVPTPGRRSRFHDTRMVDGIEVEAAALADDFRNEKHPFTMTVQFLPDGCFVTAKSSNFGPYLGAPTLTEVLEKIENYAPDVVEQRLAKRRAEAEKSRSVEQQIVKRHWDKSRGAMDAKYVLAIEDVVKHCGLTYDQARAVVVFLVDESTHAADLAAAAKTLDNAGHGYGAPLETPLRGEFVDGELVNWTV